MRHLVPAEAHEALVVLGAVAPHHHVGLEVRLPLHLVGGGGRPPFGVVGWSMSLGPDMIPGGRAGCRAEDQNGEDGLWYRFKGTLGNIYQCWPLNLKGMIV